MQHQCDRSQGSHRHSYRVNHLILLLAASGWLCAPLTAGDPLDRWHDRSLTNRQGELLGVAYGNQRYVAVGAGVLGLGCEIWTSPNVREWYGPVGLADNDVAGIAFGNGRFVAVADGLVLHSTDGLLWSQVPAPGGLRAVAAGAGLTVAVGEDGRVFVLDASFRGTEAASGTSRGLNGIAYGAGQFVAVGDETVLTSRNGSDWTIQSLPDGLGTPGPGLPWLRGVAYGNGVFVAVGESGRILRSSDGVRWTDHSSGWISAFFDLEAIAFGEGVFVAIGWDGEVFTSADGESWTEREVGLPMAFAGSLNSIAYGAGAFVVVGNSGTILQSGVLDGRPEIIDPPQSIGWAAPGDFVSFGVAASGVAPLRYQWFKDGAPLPGATNSFYSVAAVATGSAGEYTVTVSNANGVAESGPATLQVETPFPLDRWRWRNPRPTGDPILGVVYGEDQFVGVTLGGAVGLSKDGFSVGAISYLPLESSTAPPLPARRPLVWDLVYAGGRYFALADHEVLSSLDGLNWGETNVLGGSFTALAYGNGRYLAVGQQTATSFDGIHWTTNTTNPGFLTVTYGQGLFVAASGSSGFGSWFATSLDGVEWRDHDLAVSPGINSLTYGNRRFVAVGYAGAILTSTDGVHWTPRESGTPSTLWRVVFANGRFAAVGDGGTIVVSNDGMNWSPSNPLPSGDLALYQIAGGGGWFVAVGEAGIILGSSDALDWIALSEAIAFEPLYGSASGNDVHVAVGGQGTVLTSPDGRAWTRQRSGTTLPLTRVIHAGGQFVAVGAEGVVLTSVDGTNWVARESGTGVLLRGLAHGNGQYVAVGNGALLTSSDAIRWKTVRRGDELNGVAFGANTFVAVGSDGLTLTSTNAAWWETEISPAAADLYAVAAGRDRFVAVGADRRIFSRSERDWGWTQGPAANAADALFDVAYAHGQFVAVGGSPFAFDASVILASTNGTQWVDYSPGTTTRLYGVAAAGDTFMAVGDGGAILQSDPFLPPPPLELQLRVQLTGSPLFEFTARGTTGRWYLIEGVVELPAVGPWPPLERVLLTTSPQVISIPLPSGLPAPVQAFFRLRAEGAP